MKLYSPSVVREKGSIRVKILPKGNEWVYLSKEDAIQAHELWDILAWYVIEVEEF